MQKKTTSPLRETEESAKLNMLELSTSMYDLEGFEAEWNNFEMWYYRCEKSQG